MMYHCYHRGDVLSSARSHVRKETGMADPRPAGRAHEGIDELRYLILAAQREGSRRHAARLRDAGLTPAQAEVLDVLSGQAPMTLAELGRRLVCETGSPSRLVDTLVRRGLVTRAPDPADRRVVALALSPAGQTAARASAATDMVRDIIASRLADDEVEQLTSLLRRLVAGSPGGDAVAARFPQSAGAAAAGEGPLD
jgi:MarR family transcriptional regulator, organic hydroperoxide resistance regulator